MQIRISPKEGTPIYLQIVNQVKYMVASGRIVPGEKLPPVRKLAQSLIVNPNTVVRAYRELETSGILVTRQGSGVMVSDHGSPLARDQQLKILTERIDMLLAEAQQMNVDVKEIMNLIQERSRHLQP
jgi:GntR family transcriptional regulator